MKHSAVVLAVGGLDPTGLAGLAADARAGSALGVLVAPVATALTVQDRKGVRAVRAVEPDLIRQQVAAARRSLPVGAVKVGLLPGVDQATAVAEVLADFKGPLVLDPVLSATPGGALADPGVAAVLAPLLGTKTTLCTPNLSEAGVLLGKPAATDAEGMERDARALKALGFHAVLMKGGHLDGPGVPDYLYDDGAGLWIDGVRLDTPNTRGTGCVLATLVAGLLAQRQPLRLACISAKNALVILLRKGADERWPLGPGPIL